MILGLLISINVIVFMFKVEAAWKELGHSKKLKQKVKLPLQCFFLAREYFLVTEKS